MSEEMDRRWEAFVTPEVEQWAQRDSHLHALLKMWAMAPNLSMKWVATEYLKRWEGLAKLIEEMAQPLECWAALWPKWQERGGSTLPREHELAEQAGTILAQAAMVCKMVLTAYARWLELRSMPALIIAPRELIPDWQPDSLKQTPWGFISTRRSAMTCGTSRVDFTLINERPGAPPVMGLDGHLEMAARGITKILLGAVAVKPEQNQARSYASSVAHAHMTKQRALDGWQRVISLYGIPDHDLAWLKAQTRRDFPHPCFGQGRHSGPKWGQPGRGRRRKARFVARARCFSYRSSNPEGHRP